MDVAVNPAIQALIFGKHEKHEHINPADNINPIIGNFPHTKKGVSTDKNHINQAIGRHQIIEAELRGFFRFQQSRGPTRRQGAKSKVSFDRGRSKRTFAMLMLSAKKLAFKAQKMKKEAPKRAKNES